MNFAQAHGDFLDPNKDEGPARKRKPKAAAAPSTETATPTRPKVRLAYLGRRSSIDKPGEVFHAYADLPLDEIVGGIIDGSGIKETDCRLYVKRVGPTYSPGAVIEIETEAGGDEPKSLTVYPSTATTVARIDADTAATWATLDRAVFVAATAAKERAKVASHDPLEEFIAPIRRAYRNAAPSKRAAIVANVILSITKGGLS